MMTSFDYGITFSLLGSLYNNFPNSQNFQIRETSFSFDLGKTGPIIISIITSRHIRKILLKLYIYVHVSSDPDTIMERIPSDYQKLVMYI